MKDVQYYELFGGIALKNHAFSFFSLLCYYVAFFLVFSPLQYTFWQQVLVAVSQLSSLYSGFQKLAQCSAGYHGNRDHREGALLTTDVSEPTEECMAVYYLLHLLQGF